MVEAIENFFGEALGKELGVFICSMLPIIELRGGIPLGWAWGLPWLETYILCVLGNMVPVPGILLGIRWLLGVCERSKVKFLNKFGNFLKKKAEKNRSKIEKYGFWGVCLFVAVPLPITGAWTGALVCATIREKFWRAMLSTFLGVLIAGVIMTTVSFLVSSGVEWLSFLL